MAADSRRGSVLNPDFIHQRIELPKYSTQAIVELLPFGGQDERPFGAIDQFHPEKLLQMLHALAGRALGHPMLGRRVREASLTNHVVENLQRSNMHRLRHALVISYVNSDGSFIKECNSKDNVGLGGRQATADGNSPSGEGGSGLGVTESQYRRHNCYQRKTLSRGLEIGSGEHRPNAKRK